MQIKTQIVSCHTADSKPVKQKVNGTVILPPLVFAEPTFHSTNIGIKHIFFFYFFSFVLPSYPALVRPINWATVHLSLIEVTVHACQGVLMEVDENSLLLAGDPQGILGQQIRLHPIDLLNIVIIVLIT